MKIAIKNFAEKLERSIIKGEELDWYRWEVFVDSDEETELGDIDYVEYELDPSIPFPYKRMKNRASKFAINFNSFGSFPVRVTVVFRSGVKKTFKYQLNENNPFPKTEASNLKKSFVLKTTSYLRKDKQEELQKKLMTLTHYPNVGYGIYEVQAIVDSSIEGALEKVDRVEYHLHPSYEPRELQVRKDPSDKFLIEEIAYGGSTLMALVFLKGEEEPIELKQYIVLEENGLRFNDVPQNV